MNQTIQRGPQAALNDTRFEYPFTCEDNFHDIPLIRGDFDILSLKKEAEEKALTNAKKIIHDFPNTTVSDKVLRFLSLGRYRRGSASYLESAKEVCTKQIEWCENNNQPITITLSFCPFKVTNPLKTFSARPHSVDISEVGSILRFYEIALGLSQLTSFGAKMIITADGVKYHDVFGYKKEDVEEYLNNIRKIIVYFGVEQFVEIIEEEYLYPKDVENIRQKCIEMIKKEYISGVPETLELFKKLRPSIVLTLNCDHLTVPVKTFASMFNCRLGCDDLITFDPQAALLRTEFEHRANEATFRYMGTHKTGYVCDIYNKHLPHTLKATVHPKHGQIGLYAINSSTDNYFPHHGQGHMSFSKTENKLDNIRVSFAADLRRQNTAGTMKGLVLDPVKYPFSDGVHPFTIIK